MNRFYLNCSGNLAPYAQKDSESLGRDFPEKEHKMRSPYQRDRDRIVHSRAFRRLAYKTQVFINHEGDHYRTRLTHTIEVSMISRTIAKALCLNEVLSEAIALAHDVGHPPFGHAGEKELDELMKKDGGFEHNLQSLRIVEKLEKKYPQFEGLNLTREVREGIIKHRSSFDKPSILKKYDTKKTPILEAQIVDFSDEIAYTSHDLDDGLQSGLITEKSLEGMVLWEKAVDVVKRDFPECEREVKLFYVVRNVIDILVSDLIENSYKRIEDSGVKTVEDVKKHKSFLISFSPEIEKAHREMKEFLMKNLYQHEKVVKINEKARLIIRGIFNFYLKNPEKLQQSTIKKTEKRSLKRVICDYIAGMTDRYAILKYMTLFPDKKIDFEGINFERKGFI